MYLSYNLTCGKHIQTIKQWPRNVTTCIWLLHLLNFYRVIPLHVVLKRRWYVWCEIVHYGDVFFCDLVWLIPGAFFFYRKGTSVHCTWYLSWKYTYEDGNNKSIQKTQALTLHFFCASVCSCKARVPFRNTHNDCQQTRTTNY